MTDEFKPLISILIPSYNYGRYLARAIRSVLDQTYSNLELIVVENGSNDDSKQVLGSFSDPRMKVIHLEENCGLVSAWNLGYREVTGAYFSLLCADDFYHLEKLERQVRYLADHRSATILSSHVVAVDEEDKPHDPSQPGPQWIEDWINHSVDLNDVAHWRLDHRIFMQGVLYERQLCDAVMPLPEGLDLLTDYVFHLRLLRAGARVEVVPEKLAYYRLHGGNMSSPVRTLSRLGPLWIYVYATHFVPLAYARGGDAAAKHVEETMGILFSYQAVRMLEPRQLAAALAALQDPLIASKRWPTFQAFKDHLENFDLERPENVGLRSLGAALSGLMHANNTVCQTLESKVSKLREQSTRRKERIQELEEKLEGLKKKVQAPKKRPGFFSRLKQKARRAIGRGK